MNNRTVYWRLLSVGNCPKGNEVEEPRSTNQCGTTGDLREGSLIGPLRLLARSKSVFAFSILAGTMAGISNAGLLSLINQALEAGGRTALALAAGFYALCFFVLISQGLSLTFLSRLAQENLCNLRLWLTHCILAAPLQHLQAVGPHRLMAALTDDIGAVVNAQQALPALIIASSTIVAGLTYLGFLSPSLAALVLVVLVFGLVSYKLPMRRAVHRLQLARETENVLFSLFRATTEGCKELKMDARRRRAFLDEEMSIAANEFRKRQNSAWTIFALADCWGQSLYFLLIGAIVFVLPVVYQMPRGTLTAFTLVILFLGGPISMLLNVVPQIGKGLTALKSLDSLGFGMSRKSEILAETPPSTNSGQPQVLDLWKVTYRYKGSEGDDDYQLGPIDLRISPAEVLFITGGNGSGKTTLALLILGLYPPDTGEIRFGADLITNDNRDVYRQNFSAIFADPYIFESLLGYSSTESNAHVDELLVLLKLDHRVSVKDGRFSTIDLSKGQRKRLALLAAYLSDRPIYLFDEWAAEQDPIFRDVFYRELLPNLKARGKAVIVITHDDRYFHLSDRLLRLNRGQIEDCCPSPTATDTRLRSEASHV